MLMRSRQSSEPGVRPGEQDAWVRDVAARDVGTPSSPSSSVTGSRRIGGKYSYPGDLPVALLMARFLLVWVVLAATSCRHDGAAAAEPVKLSDRAFGTTWSVVLVPRAGCSEIDGERAGELVRQTLERVDSLFSTFRSDSELARFNRSADSSSFAFAPEARKVIAAALELARETGGAFDPTVAPLVRAWGFGAGAHDELPSPEHVEEARSRVGWGLLSWDENSRLVKRAPGVELDLSAVAKGYGVDAVLDALTGRYAPAGVLVEIGGDLRVMGTRAGGEPWRLGIQSPAGGLDSVVSMTGGALATSGDYRQTRGEGEARRTHIIDPRTGRPASPEVASASVLAPTALEADAVATALVVMGAGEALAYVEERPWLEALLMIRRPGEEQVSSKRASPGWPAGPRE